MKKRVFICSNSKFPRGNASANYIQYFSLALIQGGYDVYVIGEGICSKEDYNEEEKVYKYKGITYYNINHGSKHKEFIVKNFEYYKYIIPVLNGYKLTPEDKVVFYTYSLSMVNSVLREFAFLPPENVSICCVEWFQPFQYKYSYCDLNYWLYSYFFKTVYKKIGRVIPISTYLDKYFKNKGCKTLCLPIMADPYEYQYVEKFNKPKILKIMYSGSDEGKDSFSIMLKSFLGLTDDERKYVEFHLTGMTEERLEVILGDDYKIRTQLGDLVKVHGWLEYTQLIQLFQQIDFLLLAREKNKVTVSNFPSKIPEALCYGIIPIVSDVGDYTQYYLKNNFNSIIFEECTIKACSEAIKKAIHLNNYEYVELSKNARKCAVEKFYYKNWIKRICQFI